MGAPQLLVRLQGSQCCWAVPCESCTPNPPRLHRPPQAPVAASLLATSGSASWRFGSGFAFSTSAAARRAAAADGKPDAEAGNGGAAAEPGEQQAEEQQQAAEQQQASAAGLSPDDLAQALAEAQQALEEERKRVGGWAGLRWRVTGRQNRLLCRAGRCTIS